MPVALRNREPAVLRMLDREEARVSRDVGVGPKVARRRRSHWPLARVRRRPDETEFLGDGRLPFKPHPASLRDADKLNH